MVVWEVQGGTCGGSMDIAMPSATTNRGQGVLGTQVTGTANDASVATTCTLPGASLLAWEATLQSRSWMCSKVLQDSSTVPLCLLSAGGAASYLS
eukprot:3052670-Amphidinium_carterae.1